MFSHIVVYTLHKYDQNSTLSRAVVSISLSFQVSLDEGTPPNVKVIQVNATDADAGVNADITYSLTLSPSTEFYIDPQTGNFYNH